MGIAFYNNLINELLEAGITPIVTLYHYDMPCWVDEKYGGWRDRAIIEEFDYYCRVCFQNFGDRVKYWLSINEQNMQIIYGNWLGVSKGCADWFRDKWRVNHIILLQIGSLIDIIVNILLKHQNQKSAHHLN